MKCSLTDYNLFALIIYDISWRLLEPNGRNRERIESSNFHRCYRIWWHAIDKSRKRRSKQQVIKPYHYRKTTKNCDLLDLGKRNNERRGSSRNARGGRLDVDIILVVISAENVPVPQSFVDQIYKEDNMKKKRKNVLLKNKYVYLQICCAVTSQIQIIFYSNNYCFLSEIPVFIVATKVDECKLSEEGVEKKTEQIIQSFGTTP